MARITDRFELIDYIIAHKQHAGILADCTDEEIRDWARNREDSSIQSIAAGIWKDDLDRAGLLI